MKIPDTFAEETLKPGFPIKMVFARRENRV
jgi:hypothetical protein